ncbi:MAG TPA: tetratricopeptide repeat protein [Chthoniobacteraceae bacterium]|nr:tetratricopeptide repeat protein [Chthoniobacteraceae bacterium]
MNPPRLWQAFGFTGAIVAVAIFLCAAAGSARGDDDNSSGSADWPLIGEKAERALEKNPKDEQAWSDLVQARIELRDYDRAEKALANWRAKVPHPSPDADRKEADLAQALNDDARTIRALKRYLAEDPKHPRS